MQRSQVCVQSYVYDLLITFDHLIVSWAMTESQSYDASLRQFGVCELRPKALQKYASEFGSPFSARSSMNCTVRLNCSSEPVTFDRSHTTVSQAVPGLFPGLALAPCGGFAAGCPPS